MSLTFDGRFAWPIYDWMGVAKAGLEAITRYMARDLGQHGIRVNTVSAGPIRTMAGKNIPGFDQISGKWVKRAPLGWSLSDATPVGQMVCFLFSDWSKMTTGEMIHVDGGYPRHGDRHHLLAGRRVRQPASASLIRRSWSSSHALRQLPPP